MNWLILMSGPANALARYAATAAGTWLTTQGWLDASAAKAVSGAIIAVAPAVIGALTSTKSAVKSAALAQGDVEAIKLTNGRTLTDPGQVNNSAMNDR